MGYIHFYEEGSSWGERPYKIKIKDEFDRVTELPLGSLEEFAALVQSLGREKIVLNQRDNSIELIPRLVRA
jgi:hypothetical protein